MSQTPVLAVTDSSSSSEAPAAPSIIPPALEAAQKALKKIRPSEVPVTDVTIIIGMRNKDGKREEIVHDINTGDGLRIVKCSHSTEEKTRQCKEDGQLIGFEPTGEYAFNLQVKYIKD